MVDSAVVAGLLQLQGMRSDDADAAAAAAATTASDQRITTNTPLAPPLLRLCVLQQEVHRIRGAGDFLVTNKRGFRVRTMLYDGNTGRPLVPNQPLHLRASARAADGAPITPCKPGCIECTLGGTVEATVGPGHVAEFRSLVFGAHLNSGRRFRVCVECTEQPELKTLGEVVHVVTRMPRFQATAAVGALPPPPFSSEPPAPPSAAVVPPGPLSPALAPPAPPPTTPPASTAPMHAVAAAVWG